MRLWLLCALAGLGALLSGWDTGIVGGALPQVRAAFSLAPLPEGMVVGLALLGAAIGSVVSGRLAARYGPKRTILAAASAYIAAALANALAPTFILFLSARFVVGLAFGTTAMLVPIYLAEVSPNDRRGALVSIAAVYIALAILLAYLVAMTMTSSGLSWRWMLATGAIPAFFAVIGLIALPDSPQWLAAQGRTDEAVRALAFYQGGPDRDAIHDAPKARSVNHAAAAIPLFGPATRYTLLIGMALTFFQQASGINAVLYFAPKIFMGGNASSTGALAVAALIGAVNLALTLVALWLVDRAGRRSLLLWGTVAMDIVLVAVAAAVHFDFPLSLTASLLCLFVAAYALGLGAVTWTLLSEIFPAAVRERAMGAAAGTLWATNLVIASTFPSIVAHLGMSGTFMLFAAFSLVGLLFIWRAIPETKGRSLEEIGALFREAGEKGKKALGSSA